MNTKLPTTGIRTSLPPLSPRAIGEKAPRRRRYQGDFYRRSIEGFLADCEREFSTPEPDHNLRAEIDAGPAVLFS
jgi:hypothetical protein